MRCIVLFIVALLIGIAPHAEAQEINAGFVQGLWYSGDAIIAGVPIRVYAAFRNNTPHDLTGTIRFMDNGKRIGSAPVSALSGRLVETWIDWTPTYGEHSLSVTLTDGELHVIGGETIQVESASISISDTQTADNDTDTDGVGDLKDTDDDGDGISDADEVTRGTNPLIANPKPKEVTEEPDEVVPEKEVSSAPTSTTTLSQGLEQYTENETVGTLLGNVTEKVHDAKTALDAYRAERASTLSASNEITSSTSLDNATITRSSIKTKDSFLSSFVSGVASLLGGIYTALLWGLSGVLEHPALVQLALLIGILFMCYRIARRLGRRQY